MFSQGGTRPMTLILALLADRTSVPKTLRAAHVEFHLIHVRPRANPPLSNVIPADEDERLLLLPAPCAEQ
jgi:hypothetical protein